VCAIFGCLAFIACAAGTVTDSRTEMPVPLPPIEGVVVSNAVHLTTIRGASYATGTESYVYVSMEPGSVPDGVSMTVSNQRTGSSFTAGVVDGGMDPVAIVAEPGDTLDLDIARGDGTHLLSTEAVRPRRPPIIVRTVPPRGKRDVPLNTRIVVVFSEPMDSASLISGAVQLRLDGASVPGVLEFTAPDRTAIEFTPASELEAHRSYTVVVTSNARDVEGQTLEAEWVGEFSTESIDSPGSLIGVRVGDMIKPRFFHTATLLGDGRVLITGGHSDDGGSSGTATAELYDPVTRTFLQTGSMRLGRAFHHAVLLRDGQVLIVGGNQKQVRAELYDPSTGTFRETGQLRWDQDLVLSAVSLPNGEVLVVGSTHASLYNPTTGEFRDAGPYAFPFYSYQAVVLHDGRVLLAGDAVSQIYDPVTNTFRRGGETGYVVELQTMTLLQDGRVLMAGGMEMSRFDRAVLYDPTTDSFQQTSSMHFMRDAHAAAVLPNGRVLVIGGDSMTCTEHFTGTTCIYSGSLSSVEVYDPKSGRFELLGELRFARSAPMATRLQSGDILITGGGNWCGIGCYLGPLAAAELYQFVP
jgi:hypothetical protein